MPEKEKLIRFVRWCWVHRDASWSGVGGLVRLIAEDIGVKQQQVVDCDFACGGCHGVIQRHGEMWVVDRGSLNQAIQTLGGPGQVLGDEGRLEACRALLEFEQQHPGAWDRFWFHNPSPSSEFGGVLKGAGLLDLWGDVAQDLVRTGVAEEGPGARPGSSSSIRVIQARLESYIRALAAGNRIVYSEPGIHTESVVPTKHEPPASTEAHSVLDCLFVASFWAGPRPSEVLRAIAFCYLAAAREAPPEVRREIEACTEVRREGTESRVSEFLRCHVELLHVRRAAKSYVSAFRVLPEQLARLRDEPVPDDGDSAAVWLKGLERWVQQPLWTSGKHGGTKPPEEA